MNPKAKKFITTGPCPICKGTGILQSPNHPDVPIIEERKKWAKQLLEMGYSYRQMASIMGYQSTRSISYLLEYNTK